MHKIANMFLMDSFKTNVEKFKNTIVKNVF